MPGARYELPGVTPAFWCAMNSPLQEFAQEFRKVFDEYETSKGIENIVVSENLPYAQHNTWSRGGRGDGVDFENEISSEKGHYDTLESEVSKALNCNKTALRFLGLLSGLDYYCFISCMKWFCKKCGSKGGRIHKKRMSGILRRMEGILNDIDLRQFIFTVPIEWRDHFKSRAAINSLIKMVEKIIKKRFSGKPCIAYPHFFGEKDRSLYHPHINIHVIEQKGQKLRLERSELQGMKKDFKKALIGFGCRGSAEMNLWYQFYQDKVKILHKLKYMSRPCPGYANFSFVRRDPELSKLFLLEMKGFCYIRYFGSLAHAKQKDVDRVEDIKECEKLAGEPLRLIKKGSISRAEFDLKFRAGDYEKLGDGFYRIKRE